MASHKVYITGNTTTGQVGPHGYYGRAGYKMAKADAKSANRRGGQMGRVVVGKIRVTGAAPKGIHKATISSIAKGRPRAAKGGGGGHGGGTHRDRRGRFA